MSRPDLAISGKLFVEGEFSQGAVLVKGERVVDILSTSEVPSSVDHVEFGDLWVLPGLVDVHVHLRDLEETHKENFESGTSAAVAGGFSTVLAMPNTRPRLDCPERLENAMEAAEGQVLCDVGFHCGLPSSAEHAEGMIHKGAFAIKLYPEDLSALFEGKASCGVSELGRTGATLYIHAEDERCVEERRSSLGAPLRGTTMHGQVRPPECEVKAIGRVLADLSRSPLHFAHITTRGGIDILRPRLESRRASAEATVHHLFMTSADASQLGGVAKVNPPLRGARDVEALRGAVNQGIVPVIVTDHAPHSVDEKREEDYDRIPPGGPGLETALSAVLKLASDQQLGLAEALNCMTKSPARRFGLKDKGSIGPGFASDLTVVDPKEKWTVKPELFFSKAKYSLLQGKELLGRVKTTMVRGRIAYEDGYASKGKFGKVLRK